MKNVRNYRWSSYYERGNGKIYHAHGRWTSRGKAINLGLAQFQRPDCRHPEGAVLIERITSSGKVKITLDGLQLCAIGDRCKEVVWKAAWKAYWAAKDKAEKR